jgi:hypothetical protein
MLEQMRAWAKRSKPSSRPLKLHKACPGAVLQYYSSFFTEGDLQQQEQVLAINRASAQQVQHGLVALLPPTLGTKLQQAQGEPTPCPLLDPMEEAAELLARHAEHEEQLPCDAYEACATFFKQRKILLHLKQQAHANQYRANVETWKWKMEHRPQPPASRSRELPVPTGRAARNSIYGSVARSEYDEMQIITSLQVGVGVRVCAGCGAHAQAVCWRLSGWLQASAVSGHAWRVHLCWVLCCLAVLASSPVVCTCSLPAQLCCGLCMQCSAAHSSQLCHACICT